MALRVSGALSSFSIAETAEQFDLMQALTKSSSCRGCTWVFVRVFLAGSRLQVRSLDVSCAHEPSREPQRGRLEQMTKRAPNRVQSGEWTSFPVPSRETHKCTPSTCALGPTVAFLQTLAGKDVNSFTPRDTSSTRLAGLFVIKSRWTEVCERKQGRHCASFAVFAHATQPQTPTDTLQHFCSIKLKLAANQTVW